MKKILFLCASFFYLNSLFAQNELATTIGNIFSNSFYLTFSGNLKTKMTNDKSLVIVVNSSGIDGQFDKAFVLTAESSASFNDFTSTNSNVFISSDQKSVIILNNDDQTIKVIGLDNSGTQSIKSSLQNNSTTSSHLSSKGFLSYGLSYLQGRWSNDSLSVSNYLNPFNYLASADMTGHMMVVIGDEGGNDCTKCTSGGTGSSSCSITEWPGVGCSVTCNTGYYACCNSSTTKCYCCKASQ